MSKIHPLKFGYANALLPKHGISEGMLAAISDPLIKAKEEVLKTDLELWESGGEIPGHKQPLEAGFHELPERLLDTYQSDRKNSELGRILKTAGRIRESVDKVVVIGSGGPQLGSRALVEACCQPYHNDLPRSARGERPRMYFTGNDIDNDWSQALLQFLDSDSRGDGPLGHWAIVVIGNNNDTLETAVTLRQFLQALKSKIGPERLPEFVIPVTNRCGDHTRLADAIGCVDRFEIPAGVSSRFSVMSAAGLLPASIMGIDVVALLEGAATINSRFRAAPLGENPVMDFVAVNHLLEKEQGIPSRTLSVWSKSLESVSLWYDQLFTESLRTCETGAVPATCGNGVNNSINHVVLDSWRQDPLPIGHCEYELDGLNELSDKTLPDVIDAAFRGTCMASQEDDRPTTVLRLAAADESSVGQLLQMLMLATVVEGRLIGVNPYRQSKIKKHTKYMNQFLREA